MSSRRKYLTTTEYTAYNAGTTTDAAITDAEELIDDYVGFQPKAVPTDIRGRVSSAAATSFTLELARHANTFQGNYFIYCVVEIIAGLGAGQSRTIAASTYEGVVTVDTAWTVTPDSTSYYRIYQISKFPRVQDEYFDGLVSPQIYTRSIPDAVKRAVAAQIEYMTAQGATFFTTDTSTLDAESIGDYSYSRGRNGGDGTSNLVAPKAKQILKGITNRKGVMTLES